MRARVLSAVVAALGLAAAVAPVTRLAAQPDYALPARAAIPTAIPTLMLAPVPSVAPGYVSPKVAPGAPAIIGVTAQPFVALSLQDAIAMALVKSPALAVSASSVKIARYKIVQTRGAYDLAFHLEPSSSYSVNPPQSFLNAGPGEEGEYGPPSAPFFTPGPGNIVQHQSTFQYGVNGQTENGTTYQGDIQQQRTYNNTTFNAYNPAYLAQLNVAVTQPLLRNAGMNATKRQLKLAIISADAGEAQALIDASNTISQAENAYWQLVAAWRNVAIQEAALKEAIDQQRSNVRLAQRGAAATIDAVQSQTQVSNFQNQVYQALQNVAQLQNQLKILIAGNVTDPIWRANLVPSTSVQQPPSTSDLATVVARAREERPEVRQAEDRRLQADVDVALAKNQSLPQADVQAQYQSNGFAGILTPIPPFLTSYCTSTVGLPACPTPPPNTQGTMPFAYHNMWAAYFPSFNLALVVGYPLQGNVARGVRGLASEETTQAKILIQGVQERIGAEARNALQSYQSALAKLAAARSSREAAETVYASELRKFRHAESTTFLVLQRQVQLQQARGAELQAQTQLDQSIVELQRVEGTILTTNGVNLKTLGSQVITR
ncbi:MAG: TolC family protein [Candidatus Eremiobacteraeota bacterium]|nr:TolC family protein [Candidatus Eremiobacteraeota bacterium]